MMRLALRNDRRLAPAVDAADREQGPTLWGRSCSTAVAAPALAMSVTTTTAVTQMPDLRRFNGKSRKLTPRIWAALESAHAMGIPVETDEQRMWW
ncbi:hypothetical protein N9L68_02660 [bacterium]|nr:hypothetical protein [bacterium]